MDSNRTDIFPPFIASWLQLVAPGQCYNELFVKFNIFNALCLKVLISKCLGYGIIAGSCAVKIPQVVKILKAKSGEGISLVSVTCELLAISATWAYGARHNFPFSSYGEALFLALQTSSIAFFIQFFSGHTTRGLIYLSAYVAGMAYLLSPGAPMALLSFCQAGTIFMISISKIIQAHANFRNSSTGQLSVVTVYLLFLGAIARIFTSIQETGDKMTILTYCVSTLFNGIIAAQVAYYWKSAPKKKEL